MVSNLPCAKNFGIHTLHRNYENQGNQTPIWLLCGGCRLSTHTLLLITGWLFYVKKLCFPLLDNSFPYVVKSWCAQSYLPPGGNFYLVGLQKKRGRREKSTLFWKAFHFFAGTGTKRYPTPIGFRPTSGSSKINNYHGAPKTPMDMKMEKVLSTKKGQQHNSSTMADVLSEWFN